MAATEQIRAHMEVVGSDGGHVGTVDRLELGHIRLTRRDDPDGSGAHHHAIPLSAIDLVEAGQVRLTLPAQQARAMAVGGFTPQGVQEGAAGDDLPGENAAGDTAAPMGDQGGTRMIHGGGTTGPGSLPGWGTGQTTGGQGFPDDPNMDRHGGGDPSR